MLCAAQVDPCRPGSLRFRDPFAQRVPRAPYCGPPGSPASRDDGLYTNPPSEAFDDSRNGNSDGNGDVRAADVENADDQGTQY